MPALFRRACGFALPLLVLASALRAQAAPDFLKLKSPAPQVLVLGSFHFKDAGLDGYKPKYDVDILSASRQRELEEMLVLLERYKPTKIAVEVRADRQQSLDSSYTSFLAGKRALTANEREQIGFRLGQRLGHAKLYAIDAAARYYEPDMTREQYQAKVKELGQEPLMSTEWDQRFTQLYTHDDSMKTMRPLRETFVYMNSPARLSQGHGHYIVGTFHIGKGNDYLGADMATAWYNRNLRIFENIARIIESPEERVLIIIGAGHVPVLRHALQSSPEVRLVEVADVLRR